MTARRDFLKGAAASGIFFCGCAMRAAHAQSSTARALPVMVNGKRVKTIDVHSHCHFHEAVNLMGEEAKSVLPQTKGAQEHFIVIEERLKGMDAQAIDMEVLSINPFWYRKERDTAAAIVSFAATPVSILGWISPCPPECMWTCRTSTVCLLPRR
jgi:aminocarboxymuconate-semialdehyde decarboxylase